MIVITLVDKINRGLAILVTTMMMAMLVIIFSAVTTRSLFNFSPVWAEESARYLMIWVCFLGGPLAVGIGGHVGVQVVMARLPLGLRKAVRLVTMAAIELFLVVVVTKAFVLIDMISMQESPALRIPIYYVYLAVPIGCILLGIEFLYVVLKGTQGGDYSAFQAADSLRGVE
jgi:C4-dicarboxylate transporter DctQ subunit